jgi:pimeloyl-ACP methyl ester carboxylesterase
MRFAHTSDMTDIALQAKRLLNQSGSPKRRAVPRVCPILAAGEHRMIGEEGAQIATWRLEGTDLGGPAALLIHGWDDDNSVWTPLVEILQARGKAVVAMDLPGHGYSQGDACGLELSIKAINAVVAACGPVDSAAAHSFSGMPLTRALAEGLALRSVALIAPPARQHSQFERVWRHFKISEDVIAAALAMGEAEGRFYDLATLAPSLTANALFIHSHDDVHCPIADTQRAADVWPGAKFWAVDNLGHRDIVKDSEIVAMTAAWLVG